MLTWELFRNGVSLIVAAFPKLEPSAETVKAWFALLQDLEPATFQYAVVSFCQAQKECYPGTNIVATLRDLARPSEAPTAMEAWAEVRSQLHATGEYGHPTFSHPRIEVVVDALGWRTLCGSEDIGLERAHFLTAYRELSQRDDRQRLICTSPRMKALTATIGRLG